MNSNATGTSSPYKFSVEGVVMIQDPLGECVNNNNLEKKKKKKKITEAKEIPCSSNSMVDLL